MNKYLKTLSLAVLIGGLNLGNVSQNANASAPSGFVVVTKENFELVKQKMETMLKIEAKKATKLDAKGICDIWGGGITMTQKPSKTGLAQLL